MEEKFRIFLFAALFIVTLGITAIGILASYNLNRSQKHQYLQVLLYQQIFLYSFFLYGAWGRIFLGQALANMELSKEVIDKASFFIPALGIPFLILSWFMLIRFFYEVKGYTLSKPVTIVYFIFYSLLVTIGAWFINTGKFKEMEAPEIVLIRLLAILNLASNIFILIPFYLTKIRKNSDTLKLPSLFALIYLTGVLAYSAGIWFIKDHIIICVATILTMFAISALPPVVVSFCLKKLPGNDLPEELNFEGFCLRYEISKREAEIILEICSGKSNQAIADKLFITLQTVKDHAHRIYTKTGVKNRVHLTNLVREKIK